MYVIMSLDIMYICYLDMIFRRCIDCLHALCCSLVCTRPYYFIVFCCCCDGAYGCLFFFYFYFFLFKQKTASELRISDWSSDVCSSDLGGRVRRCGHHRPSAPAHHDGDTDRPSARGSNTSPCCLDPIPDGGRPAAGREGYRCVPVRGHADQRGAGAFASQWGVPARSAQHRPGRRQDRKSTRLNSSH